MAKYTIELRWLIENNFELPLQDYPIFDESYRETLNQIIIDYFYFREIGFETPALFANRLKAKMSLIMPYYNKLYQSQLLKFDPLTTKLIKETMERGVDRNVDVSGQSEGSASVTGSTNTHNNSLQTMSSSLTHSQSSTSNSKTVGSDTPQGLLQAESVNDNTWATTASLGQSSDSDTYTDTGQQTTRGESATSGTNTQENKTSTTDSQNTNEKMGENVTRTITGYEGIPPAELIIKYRESLLNINQMILDELECLFMQIF